MFQSRVVRTKTVQRRREVREGSGCVLPVVLTRNFATRLLPIYMYTKLLLYEECRDDFHRTAKASLCLLYVFRFSISLSCSLYFFFISLFIESNVWEKVSRCIGTTAANRSEHFGIEESMVLVHDSSIPISVFHDSLRWEIKPWTLFTHQLRSKEEIAYKVDFTVSQVLM